MLFSVLMCAYNVEDFLEESLDSVLGQTFRDFEVVVVNDGSTDATGHILKSYAEAHGKQLRVIEQENRGQFLARRAAIDAAQGEYCVFCDADDALRIDALSVIEAAIGKSGADVIMYNFSTSRDFSDSVWDLDNLCAVTAGDPAAGLQMVREQLCHSTHWGSLWSKAVRRLCLQPGVETGLGRIEMAEDYIQTLRALGRAKTLFAVPEPLYWYRENEQSVTHHHKWSYLENSLLAREVAEEMAGEWNPALIPVVRGGKCEMIFDRCVMLLNGSHGVALSERVTTVLEYSQSDRFMRAYKTADLSGLNSWKRLGVRLMGEGHIKLLIFYIDVLFGVTTRLIPNKVIPYTREIVD